ncbi:MAG: replicative DNA helicase, partial [Sulfuricellaceae bacterium]|nr:replicative DNA helicase [Sulfuricellaceae bacterium]
ERIDTLYNREDKSEVTGVPTGFADLDSMTSGLQPGDLIIVAGRPSMGKTAFSLNIAENVALDAGLPVAVFSMEMGGTQLVTRMIGSVGRLDQHKLRTGRLQDEDWQRMTYALGKLNDAAFFIDESPALNSLDLRARARRVYRQCGKLGLIVIDYLQLMSANSSGENRATEISEISRSLKALAKELDVPVIALSQLNRSLEQRPNKRPVMSDLRESGAIEQDADVILFIYRDEVYNPDSPEKGTAEIIIGKQRNGPIGTVRLTFIGEYTRFESFSSAGQY